MIRYLTAGESHGIGYTVIIDGFPAGFEIPIDEINFYLKKRQWSLGRGRRSDSEKNQFHILSGLYKNKTSGAPLAFFIENNEKFQKIPVKEEHNTKPRPGHADFAGMIKFQHDNLEPVWERSSGRETAARTLCGALCLSFLKKFNIFSVSHVVNIGGAQALTSGLTFEEIEERRNKSPLLCADENAESIMKQKIENAFAEKTSCGGIFEVRFKNLPVGLGTYTQWDKKLGGLIAQELLSIQGVKGMEFGLGFKYADTLGHLAHDEISLEKTSGKPQRKTNYAGGLEGGMTNGEELVVKVAVKPPATLLKPLSTLDMKTLEPTEALVTRSDVCFVASCAIVGETAIGITVLNAFIEKFGGDSVKEMATHYETYIKQNLKNLSCSQ